MAIILKGCMLWDDEIMHIMDLIGYVGAKGLKIQSVV
jgi:hypothetical protein